MRRTVVILTWLSALLASTVPTAQASPGPPEPPPAAPVPGLPDNVPPAALRPEPSLPVPAGWPFPDAFPRTSGSLRLVDGALEWSDFLYADHGASGLLVAQPLVPLAPTYGTYVYPDGAAAGTAGPDARAVVRVASGTHKVALR